MSDTDTERDNADISDRSDSSNRSDSRSAEHCADSWLTSDPGILLQLTINKAIQRDPVAQRKLAKLAGSSLRLTLTLPQLQLGIEIDAESVDGASLGTITLVPAQQLENSDCEIEGAPSDLLALMLDPQLAFDNRVQLRGNTQLANQLRDIAQQLDLDWGGLLGDRIGDAAAQVVIRALAKGREVLRQGSQNLLDDLDNWLHEEIQAQPCAAELEDFYDQIDQLTLNADRLRARIERLEQA